MIILGVKEVEYNPFYFIKNSEDIDVTPPNSVVVFEYSSEKLELIKQCKKNKISFALICDELQDILFASANGASFIICDKTNIKKSQKYADEYMFDAKILLYSSNNDDILWCADEGIDGIIFEDGISYETQK